MSGKVSGAGALALTGGSTTLGSGASLPVSNWSVSAADVTLGESLTYAGTFTAGSGATLNLSGGNLTLTGSDLFGGAATSGSHALDAKGTASVSGLTIGGTTDFDDLGSLTEVGSTTAGDAAGDVAKLTIAAAGAWDILDNSGIGRGLSTSSSIANSGVLKKTGGTGTSTVTPNVANDGTVLVSSGTLDLKGAVTGTGTDTISGASTLEFDSSVGSGQTVGFTGGGTLDLTYSPFAGQIADFVPTDTVELASASWVFSNFSENSTGTHGTLTLANSHLVAGETVHASFNFVGDFTKGSFIVQASGSNTLITHASA